MSIRSKLRPAVVLACIIGSTVALSGAAVAGPAPTAKAVAVSEQAQGNVQDVRHRRWGGVGVYIGPGYGYYSGGYYPSYGYDEGYYPRYRYRHSYYSDDGYRPYRRHSRRWAKERFEHPLGRR